MLASGSSDRTVKLWETRTGRLMRTFTGHSLYIHSVAFSPDGKSVASGGGDRTVRLWDVESGRIRFQLKGHTKYVRTVCFAADGKTLASASGDGTVGLGIRERGNCWDNCREIGISCLPPRFRPTALTSPRADTAA